MSLYEIDDEIMRDLVGNLDLLPPRLLSAVAALEKQIPIPVPTKLGAVVRTEEGVFVLADPESEVRWARPAGPHYSPDWMACGQIGRIIEVLSEGVDL